MAIEFTDQQQKVLGARGHNVLVSAAAGSGKTAVLVERIVRMISEGEHPLDIDRLLVVTFTRAAAAQMRERIGRAISQRLLEHPGDRHLQRQEILLHRAQISTIDSFCTFLLRGSCSEIDLDPGFRQMDETEARLLRSDVLRRFIEEQYACAGQNTTARSDDGGPSRDAQPEGVQALPPQSEDGRDLSPENGGGDERGSSAPTGGPSGEAFLACAEYFCPGRDDRALEELLDQLYQAAESHPYPEAWLEERRADYAIGDEQELLRCGWYRELIAQRLTTARELRRQYGVMMDLVREPDGPYPYHDLLEQEGQQLFTWLDAVPSPESPQSLQWVREQLVHMSQHDFDKLPAVRGADKDLVDEGKKQRTQDLRNEIKKRVKALGEGIDEESSLTVRRMQQAAGPVNTLIDLAIGYRRSYAAEKKERNVVDYADLEHYALQILIGRSEDGTLTLRPAALALRSCYDEVLIDEYQDSNEVQELLLAAITGEPGAGFAENPAAAAPELSEEGDHASGSLTAEGNPEGRPESKKPSAEGNAAGRPAGALASAAAAGPAGRYARFMVGDVKQSIYRFRGACPEIFQHKFDTYAFDNPKTERIDLDQNFRSRTEVLDAANGICEKIMRREIGGVEYDGTVSLKPGAVYPEPEPDEEGKDPYQTELLVVDCLVPKESAAGDAEKAGSGKKAKGAAKGGSSARRAGPAPGAADESAGGGSQNDPDDEIAAMSANRKEALAVAQRIHRLVGVLPVTDEETGEQRPARYGDIVILLRSTSGRQDAWREIFEKEGIPLYLEYRAGYFSAGEIRTVLQMLRVIDNPRQDIPLYGALQGYFGGFTPEEIGEIRALGKGQDDLLYDCLLAAAGAAPKDGVPAADGEDSSADAVVGRSRVGDRGAVSGSQDASLDPELTDSVNMAEDGRIFPGEEPEGPADAAEDGRVFAGNGGAGPAVSPALRQKCAAFLAFLQDYRARSAATPIHELIGQLVRQTGYADYVRALPGGQQRAANLNSLLVKAKAFEQTDYAGLFRFLRYLDQMNEFDVDYGEASALDEHADVVRLTTIHKSKGLEYPICFVSGLGAPHTYTRDLSGALLTDAELGLGVRYVDAGLRCAVPTLRQMAVAAKIERDTLGEELRVLYVAMTRAKEKLILTGALRDAGKKMESIANAMEAAELPARHLPESMILSRDGFLPLILKAVHALRAEGREPVCVLTVQVNDLQLTQLEDQMVQGALQGTLDAVEGREIGALPRPDLARSLERRFTFRYPHEELAGLYTKTTVTELKRAAMLGDGTFEEPGELPRELYPEEDYLDFTEPSGQAAEAGDLAVPRFAQEAPEAGSEAVRLTGAARGTAVHRLCELIDFAKWPEPGKVSARQWDEHVSRLLGAGEIPRSYESIARARTFLPFLHSEIAARMAAAEARGLLRREQPFVLGVPAGHLDVTFPPEETILIQGIIDAFFIEEGPGGADSAAAGACGAVLLDSAGAEGAGGASLEAAGEDGADGAPAGADAAREGASGRTAADSGSITGACGAAPCGQRAACVAGTEGASAAPCGQRAAGRHIVLVDYKTDRVRTAHELTDRYRVQMDYYAQALEKMLRLPVTERILYSFALNEEIRL